jgi:hypothetical protein
MNGSEVVPELIPRTASSGRQAARFSFVTDSHSLLFGLQKKEREMENGKESVRECERV